MYKRYLKMLMSYGTLAGYLLVKCETNTLTIEDLKLALAEKHSRSTMMKTLYGNLEAEPDLKSLTRDAIKGVAFDLDLDITKYFEEFGISTEKIDWGDGEDVK